MDHGASSETGKTRILDCASTYESYPGEGEDMEKAHFGIYGVLR